MLDDLIGHIVCADCLEVLKNIPDESIDLVCTDCPYHIVSGGCTNIPRKDEPSGIFNRRLAWNADNAKAYFMDKVAQLREKGLEQAEIGAKLGISQRTVSHLLLKMGMRTIKKTPPKTKYLTSVLHCITFVILLTKRTLDDNKSKIFSFRQRQRKVYSACAGLV